MRPGALSLNIKADDGDKDAAADGKRAPEAPTAKDISTGQKLWVVGTGGGEGGADGSAVGKLDKDVGRACEVVEKRQRGWIDVKFLDGSSGVRTLRCNHLSLTPVTGSSSSNSRCEGGGGASVVDGERTDRTGRDGANAELDEETTKENNLRDVKDAEGVEDEDDDDDGEEDDDSAAVIIDITSEEDEDEEEEEEEDDDDDDDDNDDDSEAAMTTKRAKWS